MVLSGHEQTWDFWVVFSCTRYHNKCPEICLPALEKYEYTHGGA